MPLANGLLHRWPGVRLAAVDLLYTLQQFEVSIFRIAGLMSDRSAGSRLDELLLSQDVSAAPGTAPSSTFRVQSD